MDKENVYRITRQDRADSAVRFNTSQPPDFQLLREGLVASGFSERDWALGPNGSPVVVVSKDDLQRRQIIYRFWIEGENQALSLRLDYNDHNLLAGLKLFPESSLLNLEGLDSVAPVNINFPRRFTYGQNGHEPAEIILDDDNVAGVLIGSKQQELG